MQNSNFELQQKLWYVVVMGVVFFLLFLLGPKARGYTEEPIKLEREEVDTYLVESNDHFDFYNTLRLAIIEHLVAQGFDRFEVNPYSPGTFNLHLAGSGTSETYPDFYMSQIVEESDELDVILQTYFSKHKTDIIDHFIFDKRVSLEPIVISSQDLLNWQGIFLFKNEQDLRSLGYVVSSFRWRKNNDAQYRINNIYISYYNIGNTRLLNPGEELSFMDEIHYDKTNPGDNIPLAYGLGTAGGVKGMYGGGICGGGFGFFGASAVNKGIDILERHNHSTRYRSLYDNTLNGENVRYPGLDTSVYDFGGSRKDFRIKNIRSYPIILVMNYDRSYGGVEEVFSLAKTQDRGTFSYLGKQGNCYVWEFNDEQFKSCYSSLR